MKDIRKRILSLLRTGYCAPQIARIAKKLKEPSTTIHYNIKRLEDDGVIKECKAVLDHPRAGSGFCAFVLVSIASDRYGDPERIANNLAHNEEIESIDICTGDWEMLLKVRTKDMDAYYAFVKQVLSRPGIVKITSLLSMHQVKSEFMT